MFHVKTKAPCYAHKVGTNNWINQSYDYNKIIH